MVSRLNSTHHSRLALAVFALLMVAFISATGHVVLASVDHDISHCLICTWYHFQGWIVAAVSLLFCLICQRLAPLTMPGAVYFPRRCTRSRSPPHPS